MENLDLLNRETETTTNQDPKQEKDRQAILAMAGRFHVTFEFIETFSPIKEYKREDLYQNESIEYIFPIAVEEDYISLQHILVINDKFVVKHWRQDWLYENQDLLAFQTGQTWKKVKADKEKVAGTWTQKVYQVDDCPRYQSYGTWVFVDGKAYWESVADAPLPRRQETRKDFNVLRRGHRVEITEYGWIMDQDNQKIFRDTNGEDKLIVWEKGFEIQNRGDYNCQPAIDYWEKNHKYWQDVRNIWDDLISNTDILSFKEEVNGKKMYDYIFELAKQFEGDKYNQVDVKNSVTEVLKSFEN